MFVFSAAFLGTLCGNLGGFLVFVRTGTMPCPCSTPSRDGEAAGSLLDAFVCISVRCVPCSEESRSGTGVVGARADFSPPLGRPLW